jgi:hypothetical protein
MPPRAGAHTIQLYKTPEIGWYLDLTGYPTMEFFLNKTGRPILFACEWPFNTIFIFKKVVCKVYLWRERHLSSKNRAALNIVVENYTFLSHNRGNYLHKSEETVPQSRRLQIQKEYNHNGNTKPHQKQGGTFFFFFFFNIWLSNILALSAPNKGYSRNASCALNLI